MTRIRNIDNTLLAAIVLLILAIVSSVSGYFYVHSEINLLIIISDFYANISAELASIAITVIIIDRLNERRRQREQTENRKKRLIREAGSTVNSVAINAIEELRECCWLIGNDSLLKNTQLPNADLSGAFLENANLSGTNLSRANLSKAELFGANLSGALLIDSNLKATEFGLNIFGDVHFPATLPDGTVWTQKTDMARFTDLFNPKFVETIEIINVIRKEMGLKEFKLQSSVSNS